VAHVRKLAELGYRLEEIQKIIKKVGLPQDGSARKETPEMDRFLTVGSLAERSGVSPRTIKHWEDKGIIEPDMRTEGGFRLYSESYVFLCQLIRDLQLFGYTLEEIKVISDDVRALMAIQNGLDAFPNAEVDAKLGAMLRAIQALFDKMDMLKEGIERWEDLLKKKKKDIHALKAKSQKRGKAPKGDGHA
jgi:DNA-binding transcriptional MerR regulator